MDTTAEAMERGAKIVVEKWLQLKTGERLLIVANEDNIVEAEILQAVATKQKAKTDLMIVERKGKQVGVFFDENETIFDEYTAVIGATGYSIVTTLAVKRIIKRGGKFLSLPLLTNNGQSMLTYDFLMMDTKKSKLMAQVIMKYINDSEMIRVTTKAGTDIRFYKENRVAGFFNGVVKDGRGYSSASIEVYVPIEETKTVGTMIIDGSLGYIGKNQLPIQMKIKNGNIVQIEENEDGIRLRKYIEDFQDKRMFAATELGIGLNSYAKCLGNCYIEDESSYGTFHIGFGRNLALGGKHEANGHFDIVAMEPDIYVDNRMIMQEGKIIIPEPQVY